MVNFAMDAKATHQFDNQLVSVEDALRFRKAELLITQGTAHVQEEFIERARFSPYSDNIRFLK
jgi:hypothetical protein